MKLVTKVLAAVGAVTLIGPVVGFVAGVTAMAIADATNPEVSEAINILKEKLKTTKNANEYAEGEAIPPTPKDVTPEPDVKKGDDAEKTYTVDEILEEVLGDKK